MPRAKIPLAALALLLASPAAAKGKPHPDVGPEVTSVACESCHAEATPEIVKAWEASKHGLVLVKCFVCHGSTGKDFTERVGAARCAGCHARQAAAVVPAKAEKGKAGKAAPPRTADCFACHEPHALTTAPGAENPHGSR